MRLILSFLLLATNIITGFAQKPVIDSSVFGKWPSVQDGAISASGNFVLYTIRNQPIGRHTLEILSTVNNWKISIEDGYSAQFVGNSQIAVFMKGDSLGMIELGTKYIRYISNIRSFKIAQNGNVTWLAYLLNNSSMELNVENLNTKRVEKYTSVQDYLFSPNGKILLLSKKLDINDYNKEALELVEYEVSRRINIWKGIKSDNWVFDSRSSQIAFLAEAMEGNKSSKGLWYYKLYDSNAVKLANEGAIGSQMNSKFERIDGFNKNSDGIFFHLNSESEKPQVNGVSVDVWSTDGSKLQSQQLKELDYTQRSYLSILHIQNKQIIQFEKEDEKCIYLPSSDFKDDYLIVEKLGNGDLINEWNWNPTALTSVYLVSVKDGSKKLIKDKLPELEFLRTFRLTSDNKFVVYYDPIEKNYFSYEVSTMINRNITSGIQSTWNTYLRSDVPKGLYEPVGVLNFTADNKYVIICDQTDLWKIDFSSREPPVNLTSGYGHSNNLVFRLALEFYNKTIPTKGSLILTAFNRNNKYDGFYRINLDKLGQPERLTMQPYTFTGCDESDYTDIFHPIKATDADKYLIRRMSASESPNYFLTSEFKKFSQLTDVFPEKKYNWLTTELIEWRTFDNTVSQGILYKPENFDPSKKYPIIFYYYEQLSGGLYNYLEPHSSIGPINIPYFVSNGYLVFTPDIHFTIGEPCQSVYNSVGSAAKYLSKLPFVDSSRMGIQGHSRGGYETNCLITETNMFSAACSGSGLSDYISLYGGIRDNGGSRYGSFEFSFQRIGATLWERPDLYIRNSPIFKADKVATPLLMMHNKADGDVPFSQGIEFFLALRRLGKKAWLLQYDGQDHFIADDFAAKDFTIRLKQFFDHYLNNSPAPKWMTHGIPAHMKGNNSGLELEDNTEKEGKRVLNK